MKKQTLPEYILELTELIKKEHGEIKNWYETTVLLSGMVFSNIEKLMSFSEFSNVKKINVLPNPIMLVNKYTDVPVHLDESYLGGETKIVSALACKLQENGNSLNEEIDIVSIGVTPEIYRPDNYKNLGFGVWQFPTQYNPSNFISSKKIEINYSIESIADAKTITFAQAKEEAKKIILKQVADLIDSGKTNIGGTVGVIVRCSPRSFKNNNEIK